MGLFPMSDHVLCAEVAMLGKYLEVPEGLLRIRRHHGRTHSAYKTPDSLRKLFDPNHVPRRFQFDLWTRVNLELVRSAWRLPLSFRDRLLCLAITLYKPNWERFRAFGGRYRRQLARLVGYPVKR
jgi:hypothetical protein